MRVEGFKNWVQWRGSVDGLELIIWLVYISTKQSNMKNRPEPYMSANFILPLKKTLLINLIQSLSLCGSFVKGLLLWNWEIWIKLHGFDESFGSAVEMPVFSSLSVLWYLSQHSADGFYLWCSNHKSNSNVSMYPQIQILKMIHRPCCEQSHVENMFFLTNLWCFV